MRLALCVGARRNYPDRLPFEHWKRQSPRVKNDMTHVMIRVIRQAIVALHLHLGGFAKVIHIHRSFAGGHGGLGLTARAFMRFGQQGRYRVCGVFISNCCSKV